jgi:hypothetical protein
LVWLDSCDKHRNEEIKQAAAGGPNFNRASGRYRRTAISPPSSSLVLVTGIQQRRVCGAEESFQPKDLVWLHPCDGYRDAAIK